MAETIHINTESPMFKPPQHIQSHSEYVDWLKQKYNTSCIRYGENIVYEGVGQHINQIAYKAFRENAQISINGFFAKALAEAINDLSRGLINPITSNNNEVAL